MGLGFSLKDAVSGQTSEQVIEGKEIQVLGPADVKSLRENAVSFQFPAEDSSVPIFKGYVPFIEFHEADLPWRYSPVNVSDDDFRPWMTLIAVKEEEMETMVMPDYTKAARFKISSEERYREIFPDKNLAAKAAHVQKESEEPDSIGISRILCTSTLAEGCRYVALLIPSYELGRLSGLGQSLEGTALGRMAWEDTLQAQMSRPEGLCFPVFRKWKFRTSTVRADFTTLASLLKFTGVEDYAKLKTRLDVDISNSGLDHEGKEQDSVIDVPVALKALEDTKPREESAAYTEALEELLELNPVLEENTSGTINMDEDPWVVPPVYGARHMLTGKDGFGNAGDPVTEVNLRLRNRIAAGLGGMVVSKNQEEFVNRAWNKVTKINSLNRQIREYCEMKEVNGNAASRHTSRKRRTDVTKKNRALLMDVAGRSLQTSGIYRKNISADSLLKTSLSMEKPQDRDRSVKCGIPAKTLLNLYDPKNWEDILMRDSIRDGINTPNKLDFFGVFYEYAFLETLGFGTKNTYNDILYFEAETVWHPVSDALLASGKDVVYLSKQCWNSNAGDLNGSDLSKLLKKVAGKDPLFQRKVSLGKKTSFIPALVKIGDEDGVIFKEMKGLEDLSQGKPLAVKYYSGDVIRLFYLIPEEWLSTASGVEYTLRLCQNGVGDDDYDVISTMDLDIVEKDGIFSLKNPGSAQKLLAGNWHMPSSSRKFKSLCDLRDNLSGKSKIRMVRTGAGHVHRNDGLQMIVVESRALLSGFNLDFEINLNDSRFRKVTRREGQTLWFNPEEMHKALSEIIDDILRLETLLWEPDTIHIPPATIRREAIELDAEEIICKGHYDEEDFSYTVSGKLKELNECRNKVAGNLQVQLQTDIQEEPEHEEIDIADITEKRITEILEQYGYTEDGQIKDNLESKYPVMAYPEFLEPTFFYLRELGQNFILPSTDQLKKNSITCMKSNPAFDEAFLMGMNTEMGRELLWREYPTDQRGSYFRKFWDQDVLPAKDIDEYYDVKPLHKWQDSLGHNHMSTKGEMLVFIVCGDLMKSYPRTVVYLSVLENGFLVMKKASDMSGWLNEDVYMVGFLNTDPSKIEGLYLTFEQLPLSLQFEKKKGETSINGEFAIVTPQAYAIPLKNM